MSESTLLIFGGVSAMLFVLGRYRSLFPYLLVLVLGLEYYSPGTADSLYTIPKMGFLALMASQVGNGRVSRLFTTRGLFFPLALFIGYMAMTLLWSVDPERSAIRATSLGLLLILFVVGQGFIRSPRDLEVFWRAFLLYGLINAAMTSYQVFSGTASYVEDAGARAGGLGVNPTEGALYTAIGLLILMAYFVRGMWVAPWLRLRVVQSIAIGVLGVGMLATGSRGGIVGLLCAIIGLVFLSWGVSRQRSRVLVNYVLLALLLVLIAFAIPSILELVLTRFAVSGADQLGNRLNIWGEMWTAIVQHPIIGNGLNSTGIATDRYALTNTYSSHNTPFGILLDGGAYGLTLFLFLVSRIVVLLRRLNRFGPEDLQVHRVVLAVLLLMGGITSLSHDFMYNKFLWALLGLLEGTNYLLIGIQVPKVRRSRRIPFTRLPDSVTP